MNRLILGLVLLSFLPACGLGFASVDNSQGQMIELLSINCNINTGYHIDVGSQVSWSAFKGDGSVVNGKQRIAGTFRANQTNLGGADLMMDLFPATMGSGNVLRDSRIQQYIFGTLDGFDLTFEMTNMQSSNGSMNWPPRGQTRQYTIQGILSIYGIESQISIPIQVTHNQDGRLNVTQVESEGIPINVRSALGLSEQLNRLLSLVPGVTMNDEIRVKMNFNMVPGC